MLEFAECLGLDLADALAGDGELLAYLFEGSRVWSVFIPMPKRASGCFGHGNPGHDGGGDRRSPTEWIRQAVTRSIADQARTIRIPVLQSSSLLGLFSRKRQ